MLLVNQMVLGIVELAIRMHSITVTLGGTVTVTPQIAIIIVSLFHSYHSALL